jgi:hypothetical protein
VLAELEPLAPPPHSQESAALVRAIRRAIRSQLGYTGLERFTVTDIHEFARRLAAQGVQATEDKP